MAGLLIAFGIISALVLIFDWLRGGSDEIPPRWKSEDDLRR